MWHIIRLLGARYRQELHYQVLKNGNKRLKTVGGGFQIMGYGGQTIAMKLVSMVALPLHRSNKPILTVVPIVSGELRNRQTNRQAELLRALYYRRGQVRNSPCRYQT